MAKRSVRKSDEDEGGGLDSLLDTMTNVVGILVMVLIATQLGVRDAVERISEAEVVDPAQLAETEQKVQITRQERDVLMERLADLRGDDANAIQVELTHLRRKMDDARTRLNHENQLANTFSLKIDDDKQKAAEAEKKVKASEEQLKKLRDQLTKMLENEAALKAKLDSTPVPQAPPPKLVTLPDPRPAPTGLRQVTFLCSANRVYPVAADDWRDQIRKKAEFLVKSKRLDGGPAVGVNQEAFFKEFQRANRSLQDDFFEIELYASGIYPRLKFIPRENGGFSVNEVSRPRSRFERLLRVLDKSKYFVLFIVLPDSYEAYMAAREVVTENGLLAGWDPQGEKWEYTTPMGGAILFGPKPPPAPPGTPPAKPSNVID